MQGLLSAATHIPAASSGGTHARNQYKCLPLPCPAGLQDAHADVVLWSRWTSYYSNGFTSIVPMGALLDTGLPVLASDLQAVCESIVQFARGGGCFDNQEVQSQAGPAACCPLAPLIFCPSSSTCGCCCRRRCWATGATCVAASLPSSSRRQVEREGAAGLPCQALACCSAAAVAASFHRIPDANHPPAPFLPVSVPMQACAYTPLPIVLLHLISGLPLLGYNVVQASSVHSGSG